MSKIVGGKFGLSWTPPADMTDVAGFVLFFGVDPNALDYNSPSSVQVSADKTAFNYPADAPAGFTPPLVGEVANDLYAKIVTIDSVGNMSDLIGPVTIPFDVTAPPPPVAFQLA